MEKGSGNACCSFGRHDCRARNESSLSLNIAAVFLLSPVVRLGHACSYIWIKKKHAHAEQLHRKQLLQFSSRDVKRAHVGSNAVQVWPVFGRFSGHQRNSSEDAHARTASCRVEAINIATLETSSSSSYDVLHVCE